MKKALITGITGQDGSYLAELLLSKGYEVHGIKRRSSSFNTQRVDHIYEDHQHVKEPRFFLYYGNLLDSARLIQLIHEIKPDEVYNMASQSHVRVSFDEPVYTAKVNTVGVIRLLEAIRTVKPDAKFYQASSSEMFGQVQEVPQNEATAFHPRSPYGCSKVYAYHQTVNYREAYGMFCANGISFNHESPRRGETFLSRKVTMAATRIKEGLQDKLYLGYLGARRDWGYAGDYVKAIWLILQHERPDDFVIATGQVHTVRDFVKAVFEYLDMDWNKYVVVDEMYLRPARVEKLRGDASKARKLLGWEPTVTFDGLVKMMVESDWKLAKTEKAGAVK